MKIQSDERLCSVPSWEVRHDAPEACGPGWFDAGLANPGASVTPGGLEQYLHEQIPISRAMGVSVGEATDLAVTLNAPIRVNINHQSTAFGGSLSAVAILSAWSLLHMRLVSSRMPSQLVIQRNSMEYLRPAHGDFTARAEVKDLANWPGFVRMLARKGRARLHMVAVVTSESQVVARLAGEFVALGIANGSARTPEPSSIAEQSLLGGNNEALRFENWNQHKTRAHFPGRKGRATADRRSGFAEG